MNIIIFTVTCLETSSGSVLTTLNILNNLPHHYKVNLVLVDNLIPKEKRVIVSDKNLILEMVNHYKVISVSNLADIAIGSIKKLGDKAIISIYNYFGEDGVLPALCSMSGIEILSTNFSSSAICFNKNWTKQIIKSEGILVAKSVIINLSDKTSLIKAIDFLKINKKIILKPVTCGASRGCFICNNEKDVTLAIEKALPYSKEILCEEFIKGREYTVGFIKNKKGLKILPVVEIITSKPFFDYEAKYKDINTQEICPAQTLSHKNSKKIHAIVERIIKILNLESHGRIDFIISNEKIYILEVNTFPGLMDNSLFPKELKAANISIADFIAESFSS